MSVLDKLASRQGRSDEVPNQELARELVRKKDKRGIQEIVENLSDRKLQNDCIKVLYEIGAIDPALIASYVPEFVHCLSSRNNRLAWGGMTALAAVADIRAKEIVANLGAILKAFDSGSVITVDNGVRVLAKAALANDDFNKKLFPYLLNHLKHCRPKQVPQHSESTLPAVTRANKKKFIDALNARLDTQSMTPAQAARMKRVMKQAESR